MRRQTSIVTTSIGMPTSTKLSARPSPIANTSEKPQNSPIGRQSPTYTSSRQARAGEIASMRPSSMDTPYESRRAPPSRFTTKSAWGFPYPER
jgi:hypothetical protein